eukprot:ANDGO_01150.mRNA.1 hypothetical protein
MLLRRYVERENGAFRSPPKSNSRTASPVKSVRRTSPSIAMSPGRLQSPDSRKQSQSQTHHHPHPHPHHLQNGAPSPRSHAVSPLRATPGKTGNGHSHNRLVSPTRNTAAFSPPHSARKDVLGSEKKKVPKTSPVRDAVNRSFVDEAVFADFTERIPPIVDVVYKKAANWTVKIVSEFMDFCIRWNGWRGKEVSFANLLKTFFEKKHGLVDIWSQVAWDFAFNLGRQRTELLELETIAKFMDGSYSLDDFRAYVDARVLVSNELFYKSPPQLKHLSREECKKVSKAFVVQIVGDPRYLGKFWSFVRGWFESGNDSIELSRWLAFVAHFFHAVYMQILPSMIGSPGSPSVAHQSTAESIDLPSSVWTDSSPRQARLFEKLKEMHVPDSSRAAGAQHYMDPHSGREPRQRSPRRNSPPRRSTVDPAYGFADKVQQQHPGRGEQFALSAADVSAIENINADTSMAAIRPAPVEVKSQEKEREDMFFELERIVMSFPACVKLSVDEPSFFLDFLYRLAGQCHAYLLVLTHGVSYFSHPAFAKVCTVLFQRVSDIFDALTVNKTEMIPRNMPSTLSDVLARHREAESNLSLSVDVAMTSVNELFDRVCKAIIGCTHVRDEVEPACAFAVYSIESVAGKELAMIAGEEDLNGKFAEMNLLEPVPDNFASDQQHVAVHEEVHRSDASEI